MVISSNKIISTKETGLELAQKKKLGNRSVDYHGELQVDKSVISSIKSFVLKLAGKETLPQRQVVEATRDLPRSSKVISSKPHKAFAGNNSGNYSFHDSSLAHRALEGHGSQEHIYSDPQAYCIPIASKNNNHEQEPIYDEISNYDFPPSQLDEEEHIYDEISNYDFPPGQLDEQEHIYDEIDRSGQELRIKGNKTKLKQADKSNKSRLDKPTKPNSHNKTNIINKEKNPSTNKIKVLTEVDFEKNYDYIKGENFEDRSEATYDVIRLENFSLKS